MPRRNPITKEQIEYVIENFEYITEACEYLNISRGTLSDLFKKYNFSTPKGYFSRRPWTDEEKQRVSDRVSGENNPFFGKKHTNETKQRMSDNHADFSGENNPYKKVLEQNPEKLQQLKDRVKNQWYNLDEETRYKFSKKCVVGEMSAGFWSRIKSNAKQKGREFNITPEYVWELFLKQDKKCALSGILLNLKTIYHVTASLDRIDSNIGYVEGNVQWVHKEINMMKNNMTDNDFINFCCSVALKNIEKLKKEIE